MDMQIAEAEVVVTDTPKAVEFRAHIPGGKAIRPAVTFWSQDGGHALYKKGGVMLFKANDQVFPLLVHQ